MTSHDYPLKREWQPVGTLAELNILTTKPQEKKVYHVEFIQIKTIMFNGSIFFLLMTVFLFNHLT